MWFLPTNSQVNDTNLIDHPHQTAVYALRKVEPHEEAILVIRRQVEVEQFEVIFDKANEDTALGLVVGERQLPFDQVTNTTPCDIVYLLLQQQMCVTVLHVQPNSLASDNGQLHVGDVIDKVICPITFCVAIAMTTDKQHTSCRISR